MNVTGRSADARRNNVSSILRTLLLQGPRPRVDLASSVGLSTGAVTRITSELTELGLVRELEPVQSSDPGRRRIPIDVRAENFVLAGIHIGLQFTTCGLMNLRGELVNETVMVSHVGTDPQSIVEQIVEAVSRMIGERPAMSQVVGCGISTGGIVDSDTGTVVEHDTLGWHNVDVASMIGDQLPQPITITSTYRALAHAEMWFGAAREVHNFVHLFIGHAIGAALVVDRVSIDGAQFRAGSIAHLPVSRQAPHGCLCGRAGCLTSVAGHDELVAQARAGGLQASTPSDVVRSAESGNQVAEDLLRLRASTIGEAVATIFDIVAPEKVILAGASLLRLSDLPVVRSAAQSAVMHPIDSELTIVSTSLGEWTSANVVASATPALDAFLADPLVFTALEVTAEGGR